MRHSITCETLGGHRIGTRRPPFFFASLLDMAMQRWHASQRPSGNRDK